MPRMHPVPISYHFILTLEPLAHLIIKNLDINGIELGKKSFKVSIFPNDLALTLAQPHTTLPIIFSVRTQFHNLLGLVVNEDKYSAHNISLPNAVVTSLKQNYNFTWPTSQLNYLGIRLTGSYIPHPQFSKSSDSLKMCLTSVLTYWHHLQFFGFVSFPFHHFLAASLFDSLYTP